MQTNSNTNVHMAAESVAVGPDGFRTVGFAEGGGFRYRPDFLAPEVADRLHASMRNDVPWTFNVANARNSQSFTVWKEQLGEHRRYGSGKLSLTLASELMELTKRAVFRRGSERFDAMGFHRLETGRDSFSFEGRMSFGTGQFGPAAILSFGAGRDLVFRHRSSQRQVAVQAAHGTLIEIDALTHWHWAVEFPRATEARGEHISVALHGSTPSRAE